jgi:hypothetical protein
MSGCRGPIEGDDDLPRVQVWVTGGREPDLLASIEHGLEEEGVPWVVREAEGEGVSLAYEASRASALKIGLVLTPEGRVVIHHEQLPADKPIFDTADATPALARTLGSNAARLAKSTPLAPVE